MARTDWQSVSGSTNNNNSFFTGIRWRYRDDLFGTSGYPSDRTTSNKDIIEYQPYVGKKNPNTTSRYYVNWLTSYYKYSYNTTSGSDPGSADNQLNISTTYRFDKATANTNYYLTNGSLSSGNPMNTNSSTTSRIIQVPHCSDGTSKLRLYFYFKGDSDTAFTYAETNQVVTLETIPRASSISVPDANIGSSTNIAINKASNDFTTTLSYKANGQSSWTTIVSKTSSQVYGWTVPTSLYSLIPNAKTIQCQIKAETYSGNTLVGEKTTTATFTATGNPVINSCSLVSTDSKTTNLVGSSRMIRYISTVQATVSASGRNSASIQSIVVNGVTANSSGIATFPNATTYSYNVVVTDSRGYTATGTYTITWTDYIPLTINATIKRHTPVDGIINISLNGNYFNSSFRKSDDTYIANTLTVEYRYKVSGSSFWEQDWTSSGVTITKSGNTYTATKDLSGMTYTNSYQFEVRAIDRVDAKAITGITVTKGQPIFNWRDGYFNVNGEYYKNGSPLSDLFLSKSGGTISGSLTTNGYLISILSGRTNQIGSQNPSYCHYTTDAPYGHWFNADVRVQGDIYGGSGYNRRLAYYDELPVIGDFARIKINTNYNASASSWTQTNVSFSDASYETSNSTYFTQQTNGIQCNFNGVVQVTKFLSTHSDNEMDIVENDSTAIAATNTKGGNTTITYVQNVTSGQLINLKFSARDTSFRIHATTQITVVRLK